MLLSSWGMLVFQRNFCCTSLCPNIALARTQRQQQSIVVACLLTPAPPLIPWVPLSHLTCLSMLISVFCKVIFHLPMETHPKIARNWIRRSAPECGSVATMCRLSHTNGRSNNSKMISDAGRLCWKRKHRLWQQRTHARLLMYSYQGPMIWWRTPA